MLSGRVPSEYLGREAEYWRLVALGYSAQAERSRSNSERERRIATLINQGRGGERAANQVTLSPSSGWAERPESGRNDAETGQYKREQPDRPRERERSTRVISPRPHQEIARLP